MYTNPNDFEISVNLFELVDNVELELVDAVAKICCSFMFLEVNERDKQTYKENVELTIYI
jgi:hypothetical protein